MQIIFPTGNVVDTTSGFLAFASTPDITLNGSSVYTPSSVLEWYYLQQQITMALINKQVAVSFYGVPPPVISSVSPSPVVSTGGVLTKITGYNFQSGLSFGFSYPGYAGSGIPATYWPVTIVDAYTLTFTTPVLPNNSYPLELSIFNPDGGFCNYTQTVS